MNRLIERDAVTAREVDAIVSTLKPFYKAEKPIREICKWGLIVELRTSTDENFRLTRAFIGATISGPTFEAIKGRYRALAKSEPNEENKPTLTQNFGYYRSCCNHWQSFDVGLAPRNVLGMAGVDQANLESVSL